MSSVKEIRSHKIEKKEDKVEKRSVNNESKKTETKLDGPEWKCQWGWGSVKQSNEKEVSLFIPFILILSI